MELIDRGEIPALDVVRADATRAFRYMKSGGVSVLPLDSRPTTSFRRRRGWRSSSDMDGSFTPPVSSRQASRKRRTHSATC
jgi:hypothetical protein